MVPDNIRPSDRLAGLGQEVLWQAPNVIPKSLIEVRVRCCWQVVMYNCSTYDCWSYNYSRVTATLPKMVMRYLLTRGGSTQPSPAAAALPLITCDLPCSVRAAAWRRPPPLQ